MGFYTGKRFSTSMYSIAIQGELNRRFKMFTHHILTKTSPSNCTNNCKAQVKKVILCANLTKLVQSNMGYFYSYTEQKLTMDHFQTVALVVAP